MEVIHFNIIALLRRHLAVLVSAFCLLGLFTFQVAAQLAITPPVSGAYPDIAYLTLSNCTDTNVQYVIQMSTNLTDWQIVQPHSSSISNFSVTVTTSNQSCFYRVVSMPPPITYSNLAIFCLTNFNMNGNNATLDSFDSSNPAYNTGGIYDPTKRKANMCLATDGFITNSLSVGNGNIYGTVYTGVGTTIKSVYLGQNDSIGDLTWTPGTSGIQPGHWFGNLAEAVPDVAAPNTNGWLIALPTAVNGTIRLAGGAYVVSNLFYPVLVSAPTTLWVQGSLSLGVTITNSGSLILYVGNTSGSPRSLTLSGNGTMNTPGFAANIQIYGLPTLTSVDLHGNASWTATIYAPEANFIVGGGGNNTQDVSGKIVANSIALRGHWNFHYDENLSNAGLLY